MLTPDNYAKGCLVDDQLMGGVAADPERPGGFVAYVLRHTTGEYLGYQAFPGLPEAIAAINAVERPWAFDQAGGCGGGRCGEGGGCGGGSCAKAGGACGTQGACAVSPDPARPGS